MSPYQLGVKTAKTELGIKDTDKVKKKIRWGGMDVHLDQPRGSTREWHDDKGKLIWSHTYPHDYGFFPKVLGADGDHLDTYVGPHNPTSAPTAYVLDKMKKDGKTFDEHKVFVGFKSPAEIRKEVTDGWANQTLVGALRAMPLADLKKQVRAGKFEAPPAHKPLMPIDKILDHNARLGTVPSLTAALAKAKEELAEVEAELKANNHAKAQSEMGDAILSTHLLAGLFARQTGHDPYTAAEKARLKVENRLDHITKAVDKGKLLSDAVQAAKKKYP